MEVHFGRLQSSNAASRLVVHIADGEARLGMRSSSYAKFRPFIEFEPVRLQTSNALAYQTLAIRRWSGGGTLSLNASPLGAVAAIEGEETNQVQLFVEGGEAHFADIQGIPLESVNSSEHAR